MVGFAWWQGGRVVKPACVCGNEVGEGLQRQQGRGEFKEVDESGGIVRMVWCIYTCEGVVVGRGGLGQWQVVRAQHAEGEREGCDEWAGEGDDGFIEVIGVLWA